MEIKKLDNSIKNKPTSKPINQVGIQGKNIEINADNVYIINNNYNQPVYYNQPIHYTINTNFPNSNFNFYYSLFPFLYYPLFWTYCFPFFPLFPIIYPYMGVIL